MSEDLFIDDLVALSEKKLGKKKKLNSGGKGKRREREVVKIFNDRFNTTEFSRSLGSGNRGWQVGHMPKHARDTFSGDLVTPANFNFTIESKGGYDSIDLVSVFNDGHSQIDGFLKQASYDADKCNKKPILVWKKSRKPILAFMRTVDLPHMNWQYRLSYREWSGISFDQLLKEPDSFWFHS